MTALKKSEQHIRDSAGRKKHHSVASAAPAAKSGMFAISGELPVHRLGFGAMQLTGRGVWGEPANRAEAIAVLRRAVELGINLIDTADSYGPYVAEELIREALYPYPAGLVIATKAGLVRTGPDAWIPLGRPEYLRQECEMSLRRLRLELYRAVSAASYRSERTGRGSIRPAEGPSAGRKDSPRRTFRSRRRRNRGCAPDRPHRYCTESVQPS